MDDGLNEGEYRRGLVLGLTLAEVLLLLLFLVLLALTALFDEEHRAHEATKQKLAEWKSNYEASEAERKTLAEVLNAQPGDKGAIARAVTFYKAVSALVPEAKLDELIEALRQAAEIDPQSPPTVLVEGTLKVKEDRAKPKPIPPAPSQTSLKLAHPGVKDGHDWPPMIMLSDAKGYSFVTGSADVPPELAAVLRGKVAGSLQKIMTDYKVDVIEVIGHTDDQAIVGGVSNLDLTLIPGTNGTAGAEKPRHGDNAGLGLSRAASVARILRQDERFKEAVVLPLSGGPLIDVGDRLATKRTGIADPNRRRIEIRLRRRSQEIQAEPTLETTAAWTGEVRKPLPSVGSIPLVGSAVVVDGDTFDLGGSRIRLWGVDAVEGSQACAVGGVQWDCGQEAKDKLSTHLAGAQLRCEQKDIDQYGRIVAACTINGADVGAWLVSQGLALDYKRYSNGFYNDQEIRARAMKQGVWRSEFALPWEWRQDKR